MTIKSNLNNWVQDRAENNEPLMLNEFKAFMKSIGYDASDIEKDLTEKVRFEAKLKHKMFSKRW